MIQPERNSETAPLRRGAIFVTDEMKGSDRSQVSDVFDFLAARLDKPELYREPDTACGERRPRVILRAAAHLEPKANWRSRQDSNLQPAE